jgi:hypothetical protein
MSAARDRGASEVALAPPGLRLLVEGRILPGRMAPSGEDIAEWCVRIVAALDEASLT